MQILCFPVNNSGFSHYGALVHSIFSSPLKSLHNKSCLMITSSGSPRKEQKEEPRVECLLQICCLLCSYSHSWAYCKFKIPKSCIFLILIAIQRLETDHHGEKNKPYWKEACWFPFIFDCNWIQCFVISKMFWHELNWNTISNAVKSGLEVNWKIYQFNVRARKFGNDNYFFEVTKKLAG